MPSGITIPRRIKNNTAPSEPKSYTPIEGSQRPHHLSKPSKTTPLVYLADGITLSQVPGLRPIPGQVGLARSSVSGEAGGLQILPSVPQQADSIQHGSNDNSEGFQITPFDGTYDEPPIATTSRHRRRRLNQHQRWLNDVIPSLLHPFMKLVETTQSFRMAPEPTSGARSCTCNGDSARSMSLSVVRFYVIESIHLTVCKCQPAALQLVDHGLFPSAPLSPSLAVDIRVLDFVSKLFLNIVPNTTAWCKTVEEFLGSQGYKLKTKDSLRKRFGEALRWYNTLQDKTNQHVNQVLSHTRRVTTCYNDGIQTLHPPIPHDELTIDARPESPTVEQGQKRTMDSEDDPCRSKPFPDPPPRTRPSDYLRSRCLLCFGGEFPRPAEHTGPDVIICLDACFKQKRNKGEKDPANEHPNSLFIPDASVRRMDNHIETIRPSRPQTAKAAKRPRKDNTNNRSTASNEQEDGYDGPLRVPRSVLATCQESFTAADEGRQKASTQFFSETALMALLCRHDRVLWIVSMTSAGEKQHYTLALIETFFQHIPTSFKVGLMYDIGCQLHQSCVKWGFLHPYLHRLSFAVSVFHAFGHQWACQLVYHPRKCVGFGLSDGEGCERLWKSIQNLIPYLRVCGHYQRLYTLDRQILNSEKEGQQKFGDWLLRRARHAHNKHTEAEHDIRASGADIEVLESEWKKQVDAQTKPLPRQSKTKGRDAVEKALHLRKSRDVITKQIRDLENIITDEFSESYLIAEAELNLPDLREQLDKVVKLLHTTEAALGLDDRHRLKQLINNPFIAARMNARALKIRLREKLRARKFELDRLERSFRHQVNEHKIDKHTESSVQRRDPGIKKLVTDYNRLCRDMYNLKSQGKAPRGAICPEEIEMDGIFALDVDDVIWQDVGLDESLDGANCTPPLWLADDNIRSGIRAMLELNRCVEEENRLKWEYKSIKDWYSEEWKIVVLAIESADTAELRYQFMLRKNELLNLLVGWQKSFRSISSMAFDLSAGWGPNHDEFMNARMSEVTPVFAHRNNDDGGSDRDDTDSNLGDDDAEEFDALLIETLDAVDMAETFRS